MGRSPFQIFHLFVINKLDGWGNPTLILLTTFLRECVLMGRRGAVGVRVVVHARKGHAMSSSSMGVLLMLLLLVTVVSGGSVGGLSDVEGGKALPQSHAASSLLHL